MLDGYFFDDPYPGYGSIGKDRNENKKEINSFRENLGNEINVFFKNEVTRVSGERDLLITDNLKQW